jgi:hypothetical protein
MVPHFLALSEMTTPRRMGATLTYARCYPLESQERKPAMLPTWSDSRENRRGSTCRRSSTTFPLHRRLQAVHHDEGRRRHRIHASARAPAALCRAVPVLLRVGSGFDLTPTYRERISGRRFGRPCTHGQRRTARQSPRLPPKPLVPSIRMVSPSPGASTSAISYDRSSPGFYWHGISRPSPFRSKH